MRKVGLFLLLLILLVPLGNITTSPAWGEWEPDYFKKVLGFIPQGLNHVIHLVSRYHAPADGYNVLGLGPYVGYYGSAFLGVGIIFSIFFFIYLLVKND